MKEDITYEEFINLVDDGLTFFDQNISGIDNSRDSINTYINYYCEETYGHELPIVWVSEHNSIIDEFYCADYNRTWVYSLVKYLNKVVDGPLSEDIKSIRERCCYMCLILSLIKGINIKDGVVYVLGKDQELINFKVKKLVMD